jgi:hypothetical protein
MLNTHIGFVPNCLCVTCKLQRVEVRLFTVVCGLTVTSAKASSLNECRREISVCYVLGLVKMYSYGVGPDLLHTIAFERQLSQ